MSQLVIAIDTVLFMNMRKLFMKISKKDSSFLKIFAKKFQKPKNAVDYLNLSLSFYQSKAVNR